MATAADGAEAIEKLRAGRVRLVLLDLAMPGVDGWQFLARRESEAGFPRAPVVLLSGMQFIRDAPGVADFIRKPIDSEQAPRLRPPALRRAGLIPPGTQ